MSSPPSSSFDGTIIRERHSSSNSTSSRPLASSSTSSLPPPSATNPTTHPISFDAILSQHANAPNPPLAALDQALSERNIFSSQNTQLWKLIEKQRSGYSQVLKELERMRAERDAYKTRLQAAGLTVDYAKKDKDRPKPLRPSTSNAAMSINSESGSLDPRLVISRQPSDVLRSRTDDRPVTPPQLQDVNSGDLQAPYYGGSSDESLLPVVVPPRSASLPYGTCDTLSGSTPSLPVPHANDAEKTPVRLPTSVTNNPGSSIPQGRSLQQNIIPSGLIIDTNGVRPPPIHHTSISPHAPVPSPKSTSPSSAPGIHPPSLTPHSSSVLSSGLLSPIPENMKLVKRDSSVSLPDEAKQYLATMADAQPQNSHLNGQGVDIGRIFTDQSGDASAPSEGEGEFLDMNDGDGEDEETEQQLSSLVVNRHGRPIQVDGFITASSSDSTPLSSGTIQVQRLTHAQSPSLQSIPDPKPRSPPPSLQIRWQSQPDVSTLSQSQSYTENTPLTPQPESPFLDSYLSPTKPMHSTSTRDGPNPTFRALPLITDDLKTTRITVSHSSIRPNDRGKEVLSFEIEVDPGNDKEPWRVEKLYSDVLALDHRLRTVVGKSIAKKIAALPEGKLWRDHAPAKSDQRKVTLEVYLQSLIDLPVRNKDEVIAFLTSDVVRDTKKPVMQVGHKEGYLTKRGKNFGGWKTRYFVLQGPVLEYYESRGGAHLGSIAITNAQIGRQQRTTDSDDEKNYRHAFLIIEAKKGPGGSNPRHVLCAESDSERDSWVDILVRYVTGMFNEDSTTSISVGPSPISVNVPQTSGPGSGQPRSSVSSNQDTVTTPNGKRAKGVLTKDDISRVIPPSQDTINSKLSRSALLPGSISIDELYSSSPTKSAYTTNTDRDPSTYEQYAKKLVDHTDAPLSSSLPTTSPLEAAAQNLIRSSSELGHYTDVDQRGINARQEQGTLESGRSREPRRDRKSYHPGLAAVFGSPTTTTFPDRPASPNLGSPPPRSGDLNGKVKISGPLSGAPIPVGYKFGSKDAPVEGVSPSERREKAKSRSFWNFGRPADRPPTSAPRAVFGVPLDESLDVAEIARLPAVIFRCIQYLEAKQADQEEGIYRLSGSSAVIKGLRDRFNTEGDVDLLASDEYWDPHAIAGLLKSFLRELPASILTRELHMKFLSVMDFVEPQERIRELSHLIALLPIANYSLLRALTAHLILIVQNSFINKMTMRNVGIVFSPTLGIPAGVFSLMLAEFNRVFNVDAANNVAEDDVDKDGELSRRNSRQYSDAAADELLGLAGRTLHAPSEEGPSEDSDSLSIQYESGNETTENDATVESGQTRSSNPSQSSDLLSPVRAEMPAMQSRSHAAHVAASRGLNIAVSNNKRGNRHSRIMGLPVSPRPPNVASSPVPPPLQTAKQS